MIIPFTEYINDSCGQKLRKFVKFTEEKQLRRPVCVRARGVFRNG